MRKDEKHLFLVPAGQLSRFSHLVRDLRNDPEKVMREHEEFASVLLDIERDGIDATCGEFCMALADLLSDTVWPAK